MTIKLPQNQAFSKYFHFIETFLLNLRYNGYMKEIAIAILKIIFRLAFVYGLCLLFTVDFNPLNWSITAKVWLVVISFILLSQD